MRVTVCELPNDPEAFEARWTELCDHTRSRASELVVLPEMPFHRWLAARRQVDRGSWAAAVQGHVDWMSRLPELGSETVLGTRPVVVESGSTETRLNEGFVWTATDASALGVHRKRYLPDEEGFWEASWYSPGDDSFDCFEGGHFKLGFAICTELWFMCHLRDYGRLGAQILVCPRATLAASTDKWLAGGRAAAVVSGAFCLSSNFSGTASGSDPWGGTGWIVEPEEGEVQGTTSSQEPFLTLDLDLTVADAAKATYPRYVR